MVKIRMELFLSNNISSKKNNIMPDKIEMWRTTMDDGICSPLELIKEEITNYVSFTPSSVKKVKLVQDPSLTGFELLHCLAGNF